MVRANGTYARVLERLLRNDVLILNDLGIGTLMETYYRDLLEPLEDRDARRVTIVASQIPVERWHGWLCEPTLADAILDRLVHRSYRLVIKGPSKRKKRVRSKPKTKPSKPRRFAPTRGPSGSQTPESPVTLARNHWSLSPECAVLLTVGRRVCQQAILAATLCTIREFRNPQYRSQWHLSCFTHEPSTMWKKEQ